jgi:ADP-heptose:LPS heptosyltransferase
MNILITRFSSMGDVLLQTAVMSWLKETYQNNINLYFVTSLEFKPLVEDHPLIKESFFYDRRSGEKLSGLIKKIKTSIDVDLIIDLHATTRSTLLRWCFWNKPRLVVDKRRLERWLLQRLPISKKWASWKFLGLEPQVQRIPRDWEGLFMAPLLTKRPLTSLAKTIKIDHPNKYIAIAPVASFEPKKWPLAFYRTLIQNILAETHYDVVVIAGKDDDCSELNDIQDNRFLNLQGKTTLLESMGWAQGAQLVIGNDSGMNHIAEASGVKVLTLFGPTHEAFGFAPHLPGSKALSVDLWCRPCSATGKRACFRSEPFCMTKLTPALVWATAKEML